MNDRNVLRVVGIAQLMVVFAFFMDACSPQIVASLPPKVMPFPAAQPTAATRRVLRVGCGPRQLALQQSPARRL